MPRTCASAAATCSGVRRGLASSTSSKSSFRFAVIEPAACPRGAHSSTHALQAQFCGLAPDAISPVRAAGGMHGRHALPPAEDRCRDIYRGAESGTWAGEYAARR